MILSFLLSATFLTGAIEIHRLNPQIYDVVCPFLLLLFIVTLDLFPSAGRLRTRRLCAALCGLSLTMAELTRPFMVFVVPFLVLSAVGVMRGKRCLPYFFVPLLLLSGSWHAQVAIRYQRLAWTNHTGFNLLHAWPMVHRPQLVPELHSTPLARGRRLNLNTDEHSENSRRLARAVLAYVVAHPAHATLHGLERIYDLLYRVVPSLWSGGERRAELSDLSGPRPSLRSLVAIESRGLRVVRSPAASLRQGIAGMGHQHGCSHHGDERIDLLPRDRRPRGGVSFPGHGTPPLCRLAGMPPLALADRGAQNVPRRRKEGERRSDG